MNGKGITVFGYKSPCGVMLIGDYDGRLCMCDWDLPQHDKITASRIARTLDTRCVEGKTMLIERAVYQLDEYFKSERRMFDLPVTMVGTEFQQRVWRELRAIPCGETVSYSQLAERLGNPRAVRAVASACRANALSIVIPCHRVIGANGKLTGYAGGLDAKRFLLDLEATNPV